MNTKIALEFLHKKLALELRKVCEHNPFPPVYLGKPRVSEELNTMDN